MIDQAEGQVRILHRRALSQASSDLVQVCFRSQVLDRYRSAGYSIIRTNTVGRVQRKSGWSLDFGISDDDRLVHASLRDLLARLPQEEREHWADHVATLPLSRNFLQMQMAPGSCIDDGEIRAW